MLKKKGNLYFPGQGLKKRAWVSRPAVYEKAAEDPLKFWEERARELKWQKKWTKTFVHKPPYFEWFKGGKINITENCLDENLKERKNKPALIWVPEPIGEKERKGKPITKKGQVDKFCNGERVLTYFQLWQEVNRFAAALKKLGVRKGDRVGVYLPMVPEAVIAMLGCARIGAVHVVVFSAFSPAALKIRLQDTESKVLITADGYYRRGEIIDLKKNADEGVKGTKVRKVIVVKRLSSVIPSEARNLKISWQKGRDLWWQEVVSGSKYDDRRKLNQNVVPVPPEPMDSDDLLFILYTSGSTGIPKGTEHVCGGYTVQAKATGKWIFDLHEDDILWCTSDPGWITGHTYTVYSPLLNGVTTLMYEGAPDWPVAGRWAQIIEKYRVTIFYTAPTAIRMFEKCNGKVTKQHKFETLRLLGSVGEPIDEAAWQWYFREVGKGRCPLVDTWWQTETGGILISSLPGVGPFKPAFAGLPFPGVRMEILEPPAKEKKGEPVTKSGQVDKFCNGKPVKVGREGNLVMLPPFAPGLLRGIYKNPKKYLETYWLQYGKEVYPNGVYFTSDSALRDRNGLIRIVGRVDDVLKVAGHRLTTGELESAISLLPDITESAVVGKPDEIKGEVPVAFVVARKSQKSPVVLEKEVVGQVRKEIGPIASPQEVYIVDDLPKTRSGKIMRRILKRLFTGEPLGDLSTLANPQSVDAIKKVIANKY